MKGKTEIKVQGVLDKKWKLSFESLEISYDGNNTTFLFEIKDESHLHGVLNLIRDLNLILISVNPVN
jgi:hypothetical protein